MPDQITWLLNADASQVRAEMTRAAEDVKTSTGKMVRDLDGVTSTHNNLLRSDHRVAGSLRMLASEALSTGSAMGSLSALMEGLAMATNVSLPALIGLEVIGKVISQVAKAHEEAVKLNKELDEAAKPRDPKSKVPIDEDIRRRREAAEKSRKEREENEAYGKTWHWYDPTSWHWGDMADAIRKQDKRVTASGFGSDTNMVLHKREMQAYDPEDEEIQKRKEAAAEAAADAIERQAEAEKRLKELSETVAKEKMGKLQFSLAELAKEGRDTAAGDDSRPGAGKLARRAVALEGKARKEMLAEHYDTAFDLQNQADQIKNSIIPLKDSEKDMLNALERATVLKEMSQHLRSLDSKMWFRGI